MSARQHKPQDINERRWRRAAYLQRRREVTASDLIDLDELPDAISMTGWMRTEEEELDFLYAERHGGKKRPRHLKGQP